MSELDLTLKHELVLYFDTHEVDARTLGRSLVGVASLSEAAASYFALANDEQPTPLSVTLTRTEPGSVFVYLRFLSPNRPLGAIICATIAGLLVEAIHNGHPIEVHEMKQSVIIKVGPEDSIAMSQQSYKEYERLRTVPQLRKAADETVKGIVSDPNVRSFGITTKESKRTPIATAPKEKRAKIPKAALPSDDLIPRRIHRGQQLTLRRGFSSGAPTKLQVTWNSGEYHAELLDKQFAASQSRTPRTFRKGDQIVADIVETISHKRFGHFETLHIAVLKVRSVSG